MLDSFLIRGILFYIWWFCHALQKKILNIILWISSKIPHTKKKKKKKKPNLISYYVINTTLNRKKLL